MITVYIHSFGLQFTLHSQFWIDSDYYSFTFTVITVIITVIVYIDCFVK